MSKERSMWARILLKVPILKGLPDCTYENHAEAIKEVGINFFFSMAPIWLSLIFLLLQSMTVMQSLNSVVGQGELFMYCTAILAPIFYIVFRDFDEFKDIQQMKIKKFPGGLGHIVFVVFIMMICSFAFGAIRAKFVIQRADWFFWGSIILYLISLFIIYLATVYSNSRITPYSEEINAEAAELTAQLGERNP